MPLKIGEIKLYSIAELAKDLKVTKETLRAYLKKGKLKGQKMGTRWYVTEESLKEFFNTSPAKEKVQRELFTSSARK